jgi:predicted alpha/beta-fold hydrolase
VQTVLSSRGRARWVRKRAGAVLNASDRQILTVAGGIRLEAWLARQSRPAPAVILIHGWLGHAGSSYLLSAAATLWSAGFSVLRLNLRDHGDTSHLNEEMFHSARIDEVVQAIEQLVNREEAPVGLAGFSLGGNFALRVARVLPIETLAICPAMDPATTMTRIDTGSAIYRLFFVRKWQRALQQKQLAFPDRYSFSHARRLATVNALTELFVREHTDFQSMEDYFSAYSLMGDALAGTCATILHADDDPVIPSAGFTELPTSLEIISTTYGGHCAFVDQLTGPSWSDDFLVRHFSDRLAGIDSPGI